jgi:DNA processing protein
MENSQEVLLAYALSLLPGLERYLYRLFSALKSFEKIWSAQPTDLLKIGLSPQLVDYFLKRRSEIDLGELKKKLADLKNSGIEVVILTQPNYPQPLRQIFSPPPILFCRGYLFKKYKVGVAIVGARRASLQGRKLTEKIAAELSDSGVTVISGLAQGIDTAAHRGALIGEGKTIAVLGCGIDTVYPKENKRLYHEITKKGAVISEFPPGQPPLKQNFPRRNRLISGLSQATVVVEAGEKSGALITAQFALEQGRDVLAFPGWATSPLSKGTNGLIKDGAVLVESSQDILEAIGVEFKREFLKKADESLDQLEKSLLHLISFDEMPVDEIIRLSPVSPAQTISLLTLLELKGFVAQGIGQRYLRLK